MIDWKTKVFMAVKNQAEVFQFLKLCSVAVGYQHFGGPHWLHLQSEDRGNKVLQKVGILPHSVNPED
jgi:hypothetical protein